MVPEQFLDGVTLLGIIGIVGAAAKWLWDQMNSSSEQRIAELKERERRFEGLREQRMSDLEEGHQRLEQRIEELVGLVGRQRTAIRWLVVEVSRLDPQSPVLVNIEEVLGDEMPFVTPPPNERGAL